MNLTHAQAQSLLEQSTGSLTPAEITALQAHLDSCEACVHFRADFQRRERFIHQALHALQPRPQYSKAELRDITARIRRTVLIRRFWGRLGSGIQTLTWAGMTAALMLGLVWLLNHIPQPTPEPAATAISSLAATPDRFTGTLAVPPPDSVPITPNSAPVFPLSPTPASVSQSSLLTLYGHNAQVLQVAYSPNGEWLASADADGMIHFWQAADGTLIYSFKAHSKAVTSFAFSPDGMSFATGSKDGEVKLWETESGNLINMLLSETSPVKSLAFSPNGELLAASLSRYQVYIIRVATGLMINSSLAHTRFDVSTDTNNNYVLASSETAVWLDDLSETPFAITLRGQGGRSLDTTLSADGKLLASGSTDQKIYVWQIVDITYTLHTEENNSTLTERLVSGPLKWVFEGHTDWVNSLAFSPNMKLLISGSEDSTIKVWSLADGLLQTLTGHQASVNCVAVSPDGLRIASASDDGTINLWSLSP